MNNQYWQMKYELQRTAILRISSIIDHKTDTGRERIKAVRKVLKENYDNQKGMEKVDNSDFVKELNKL